MQESKDMQESSEGPVVREFGAVVFSMDGGVFGGLVVELQGEFTVEIYEEVLEVIRGTEGVIVVHDADRRPDRIQVIRGGGRGASVGVAGGDGDAAGVFREVQVNVMAVPGVQRIIYRNMSEQELILQGVTA